MISSSANPSKKIKWGLPRRKTRQSVSFMVWAGMGFLACLIGVIGLLSYIQVRSIRTIVSDVLARGELRYLSTKIRVESLLLSDLTRDYILQVYPEDKIRVRVLLAESSRRVEELFAQAAKRSRPQGKQILSKVLAEGVRPFIVQANDLMTIYDEEGQYGVRTQEAFEKLTTLRAPMMDLVRQMEDRQTDLLDKERKRSQVVAQRSLWLIMGGCVVIFIVALGIGFVYIRRIIIPLNEIGRGVESIARGEFDHSIDVHRRDEFWVLAEAFNGMANQLRGLINGLEQRVADRTAELSGANEQLQQEIEERKKVEEALHELQPQQKAILNNIPDMAWLKDREGRYIAVNEPFAKMRGLSPIDVVGRNDFDLWPKELAERYSADDQKIMASGELLRVEEPIEDSEGNRHWFETIKKPVYSIDGKVMGMTGIARDIEERKKILAEIEEKNKQLEKANENLALNERALKHILYDLKKANAELKETQGQLLQSEKMVAVGQLSAGLAHEIKNPLAIILLAVESLEEKIKMLDEGFQSKYRMIKNSAERMNTIIMQLLNFSRTSSMGLKNIKVNQVIDAAITITENSARINDIEIKKNLFPDDIVVSADEVLLQQALVNIISNAIDAMGKKGSVFISTAVVEEKETSKRKCMIKIVDTGPGIREENLASVFNPFFTTKEQGKGTGLGLSLTYTIIQRHGGTLTASNQPGQGAAFSILLPMGPSA